MRTMTSLVTAMLTLAATACTAEEPAGDEDGFEGGKADYSDKVELARYGVAAIANQLSRSDLVNRVGLSGNAADSIVAHRAFASLEELDAAPSIGTTALARLASFARTDGWVETINPVPDKVTFSLLAILADNALTFTEADALAGAVLAGGMNQPALRGAQLALENFQGTVEDDGAGRNARDGGLGVLETLYFGMPRSIEMPAGCGFHLDASTRQRATQMFFADREPDPNVVEVVGRASQRCRITFWIYASRISVDIAAGSSSDAIASRIAAAINAAADFIVPTTTVPEGPIDFESDTHPLSIHATTAGSEVFIDPQLDS